MNEDLIKKIRAVRRKCEGKRALVVGDVILDVFLNGVATGLSRGAPVPVILNPMRKECLGGAAHVAAQLSRLGMNVRLYGAIGSDKAGSSCSDLFLACGIGYVPLPRRGSFYHPTIVKTRICAGSHQYVRLDEEPSGLSATIDGYASTRILEQENDCHVIVVVDYGKGTCAPLDKWIRVEKGNIWQIYRSKQPEKCEHTKTVLCVNSDDFVEIKEGQRPDHYIATAGGYGLVVGSCGNETVVPATNRTFCNSIGGAGEVIMATTAAVLSVSSDVMLAARIANRAAGVSVEKPFTSIVSWDEIINNHAEEQ